jgi:hypothetical protein
VQHIADVDYRTTCVQFVTCLRQVRAWSQAHPEHVPIPIMLELELERGDSRIVNVGVVVAPAWDGAALNALDAEIRSVFEPGEMITPDVVRGRGRTLEQPVLRDGWPKLRDSRSDFVAELPEGSPARCNPVNAPGGCRDNRLKDVR